MMKVLVIGGGIVGVTTAYYLAQAGMDVTVLEAQEEHGDFGATAGNAGFLSPSDAFAWASPSALKMATKSLLNPELGVRYKFHMDPALWRWTASFLSQCRHRKWAQNSDSKYRLADYSIEMLSGLRSATNIHFDESDQGITYASRSPTELAKLSKHFSFLEDRGLKLELLDREALHEKLPMLDANSQIYAGAVYSPNCKTGDSTKFTKELSQWCVNNTKCRFVWGACVEKIMQEKNKITGVLTTKGEFKADAYVLAAGAHSSILAKQLGINLPIYPIKGFSITAPLIDTQTVPMSGFDDTDKLVALSVFRDRLRIVSSAVFDGFDTSHRQRDFQSILNLAKEILPDVADYSAATYWAGLRPMTPTSLPILGVSSIENLYLNVGHGNLGWTMSCGTGKILADIITNKTPQISIEPFLAKI
jgi:D-amino-acid dehydrogenase